MFHEIDLPAVQAITKHANSLPLADSFPFTEEQLKGLLNDEGPNFESIAANPGKFDKEYPIRTATVEAIIEMRSLKSSTDLPESFQAPIDDMKKKFITEKYQRAVTERQGILDELKDKLDQAGKKRDAEKSKRWLANFDYASAQVRARLAYVYEYNTALGNVKLEKLPEIDAKIHSGWQLATVENVPAAPTSRKSPARRKSSSPRSPPTIPTRPGPSWPRHKRICHSGANGNLCSSWVSIRSRPSSDGVGERGRVAKSDANIGAPTAANAPVGTARHDHAAVASHGRRDFVQSPHRKSESPGGSRRGHHGAAR